MYTAYIRHHPARLCQHICATLIHDVHPVVHNYYFECLVIVGTPANVIMCVTCYYIILKCAIVLCMMKKPTASGGKRAHV
jgi:hypothetical protein